MVSRWRRWGWSVALAAALALGLDLSRAPESQASARFLLRAIDVYQATLSPISGATCRFEPTCSRYAEGSIRRHGALGGSGRALWRLARCGSWTEEGTADPP